MHVPRSVSLVFLVYLLAVLPWIAIRSARLFRAARAGIAAPALPSRTSIWVRTIVAQAITLFLAWYTARVVGYRIFAVPTLGLREVAAAAVALAAYFGLRAVSRAIRSDQERRDMLVYFLAPRMTREWLASTGTVLVASVAEEAAYRGVGMAILANSLGNPYGAAVVCAVAFALAHWTQGWKSAAVIFLMALVMHGLVAFTATLVLAMLVHAVYDLTAGYLIAKEAARFDQEAAVAT